MSLTKEQCEKLFQEVGMMVALHVLKFNKLGGSSSVIEGLISAHKEDIINYFNRSKDEV